MDAGEHDLLMSLGQQAAGLLQGFRRRQGAHRSPHVGDDAVAAELVAAVLDLEIGPGPALEAVRGYRAEIMTLHHVGHGKKRAFVFAVLPQQLFHQLGQAAAFLHAHDEVGGLQLFDLRRRPLGVAAADRQQGFRLLLGEAADQVAGLFVRHLGDGAGVDDDQPRLRDLFLPPARRLEQGGQGRAFLLVDLAAEIMQVEAALFELLHVYS